VLTIIIVSIVARFAGVRLRPLLSQGKGLPMFTRRWFIAIATGAAIAAVAAPAGFSLGVANAANKELVEYRLTKWKNAHFDEVEQANTFVSTLKKLECESEMHDHNGHTDVRYRCPKWKQISLKTHDEAHKWEHWLKARGFETKHVH
jgi:hypothetical protein